MATITEVIFQKNEREREKKTKEEEPDSNNNNNKKKILSSWVSLITQHDTTFSVHLDESVLFFLPFFLSFFIFLPIKRDEDEDKDKNENKKENEWQRQTKTIWNINLNWIEWYSQLFLEINKFKREKKPKENGIVFQISTSSDNIQYQ